MPEVHFDELMQAAERRRSRTKQLRLLNTACGGTRRTHCASNEDRAVLGESYWHWYHYCPGLLMCVSLATVLRQTGLRKTGGATWAPTLPHKIRGERSLNCPPSLFDDKFPATELAPIGRKVPPSASATSVGTVRR